MRIMFYVAYEEGEKAKAREAKLASAMIRGCAEHGDTVDTMPAHLFDGYIDGYDMAMVMGIKGISPDVFGSWIRAGKQVLLIDKGFTRPKINVPAVGDPNYWRMCINDPQPNSYAFAKNRPSDRIDRITLDLKPFRAEGSQVILAGSSNKYYRFFGIEDPQGYHQRVVKAIRKMVGHQREIWYRPKPSFYRRHKSDCPPVSHTVFRKPTTRLYTDLEGAHILVTHGSNACFDAIVNGVPVLNTGLCASEPISESDIRNIQDPFIPTDEQRRQWLADIAYCQSTHEEMVSGYAWSILSEETPKVLLQSASYQHMDEAEQLVAQYRYLHSLGKYYKGKSVRRHRKEISEAIQTTGAVTILDYGCGKGWQYTKMKIHENWGVPEPWLYDPAVPGIDKKPRARFDGVICTDVLEHIPEYKITETLRELIGFAEKFVFMSIALYPATKNLPDGRNAHVTIRPATWWHERIEDAASICPTKPRVIVVYCDIKGPGETSDTNGVLDDEPITGGTR